MSDTDKKEMWMGLALAMVMAMGIALGMNVDGGADAREIVRVRTQKLAEELCDLAYCPAPVEVVIHEKMPTGGAANPGVFDGIVAFTTKGESLMKSGVWQPRPCELHFTERSAESVRTVAHEVCHCSLDYAQIGGMGWVPGTSSGYVREREIAAGECSDIVTRRHREQGR